MELTDRYLSHSAIEIKWKHAIKMKNNEQTTNFVLHPTKTCFQKEKEFKTLLYKPWSQRFLASSTLNLGKVEFCI